MKKIEPLDKGVDFLREFKKFAMRGNVIDLAIGVIIGGAFGRIVTSLVNDIVMPTVGLLLGRVDFKALYFSLDGKAYESLDAARRAAAPILAYGSFIQAVVDFLIIALAIFFVIRQINKLTARPAAAPSGPTNKECPQCLSSIPIKAVRCAHCTQPVP